MIPAVLVTNSCNFLPREVEFLWFWPDEPSLGDSGILFLQTRHRAVILSLVRSSASPPRRKDLVRPRERITLAQLPHTHGKARQGCLDGAVAAGPVGVAEAAFVELAVGVAG